MKIGNKKIGIALPRKKQRKVRVQLRKTNEPRTDRIIRSLSGGDLEVDRYALALTAPFHPSAGGAKVPDQYCLPTTTRTIRVTQTCTVASNQWIGIITNNPCMAIACQQGTMTDGQTLTALDNTAMGTFWGVDTATFKSQMDSYRIVGMGVRVTGLSSMTNASGKFVIGTYPSCSWAMAKQFTIGGVTPPTHATNTPAVTWKDWGLPYNGSSSNPSLLVNYPGNRVISAMEMTENMFEIVPKLSDPEALIFRPCGDSYEGPYANDTGLGNADWLKLKGFETTFIYVSGAATGSTFDLEVVYHLEGRPNISAGTPGTVVPMSSASSSPVAPVKFMKVLTEAAKQPTVKRVVETAAGFIHPMLGKIAGSLLSLF